MRHEWQFASERIIQAARDSLALFADRATQRRVASRYNVSPRAGAPGARTGIADRRRPRSRDFRPFVFHVSAEPVYPANGVSHARVEYKGLGTRGGGKT